MIDPSQCRPPPRFVPVSEGDKSFPRRGGVLPTLAQFLPPSWGQTPAKEIEEAQEGTISSQSSSIESCNVIHNYSDTPSEDVFTPEEQEVLNTEDTAKEVQVEEVNTNLHGGKILPEPLKIKSTRVHKSAAPKEAPLQVEEHKDQGQEKKNGQIWACVDFCDVNRACPKDDFPLPITELVVDSTTSHGALSFMDASSCYNHTKMDRSHIMHKSKTLDQRVMKKNTDGRGRSSPSKPRDGRSRSSPSKSGL